MEDDIERRAARLLVRTSDARILLLRLEPRFRDPFWVTPGGGLDPGESLEDAARRELREEVGVELPLGPCIWHRRLTFTWEGRQIRQREHTFLVEVPVPFDAVTEHAGEEPITGSAWHTPAEIRALPDPVYPEGLADLLVRLSKDGFPDSPLDLGDVVEG